MLSFFLCLFIYFLRVRECVHKREQGRGERESQPGSGYQCRAGSGFNFIYCEIMTWAEIKSWTLNWLSHPRMPKQYLVVTISSYWFTSLTYFFTLLLPHGYIHIFSTVLFSNSFYEETHLGSILWGSHALNQYIVMEQGLFSGRGCFVYYSPWTLALLSCMFFVVCISPWTYWRWTLRYMPTLWSWKVGGLGLMKVHGHGFSRNTIPSKT